jgi:hypothetical protein
MTSVTSAGWICTHHVVPAPKVSSDDGTGVGGLEWRKNGLFQREGIQPAMPLAVKSAAELGNFCAA